MVMMLKAMMVVMMVAKIAMINTVFMVVRQGAPCLEVHLPRKQPAMSTEGAG